MCFWIFVNGIDTGLFGFVLLRVAYDVGVIKNVCSPEADRILIISSGLYVVNFYQSEGYQFDIDRAELWLALAQRRVDLLSWHALDLTYELHC